MTVNNVDGPERGTNVNNDCDTNYYGYLVTFTVNSDAVAANNPDNFDGAWLVYGGRLAQAYDPLPAGVPSVGDPVVSSVPVGKGASSINGTFQSRIGGTGDKTINFSGAATEDPEADLGITKQCADFTAAGEDGDPDKASFTITVHNYGPSSATGVSMVDVIPSELTWTGVYTSKVGAVDAGTCALDGGTTDTVECQLASLDANSDWIVTLETTINEGVAPGTAIANSASTSAQLPPEPDPDPNANSITEACSTPVTVSYFEASKEVGAVRFDWTTTTESGNLGFNIFAVIPEGRVQLNEALIPSKVISSMDAQDYSVLLNDVGADSFIIQSVDVRGFVEQHGPFELGEVNGMRLEPDLIDWAAVRAESEATALLRSLNNSIFRQPLSVRSARGGRTTSVVSASTAANLTVNEDGLYRVTYEQLRDSGLDLKGVPNIEIALTNHGESVPVYVSGRTPFGRGDYIEFYGQGLNTLYTADNVYTVQANAGLAEQVVKNSSRPPRKATPAGYYMESLIVDDNNIFFDFLGADPWFAGYLYASKAYQGWDFPFAGVDNYVAGAAPVEFTAELWGGYEGQHHVFTELNGELLANRSFRGIAQETIATTLPEGALQNGQNILRISSAVAGVDLIVYDKLSVTYPRAFVARAGELTFSATDGDAFTVENLNSSSVTVYRIGDGLTERLTRLKKRDTGDSYAVTFVGTSVPKKYVVADASAIKSPAAIQLAAPLTDITSGSVNTLIIAHPDFIGEDLTTLGATRQAQGYSVKIVDVTQVYAQFSDGIFDPQAIKQYLTHAVEEMDVQMVLLVGADTYDYRNYTGNSISFMPSLYAQTDDLIQFAPVDPLYVDVDGNNAPDVAIGRLPVRNSTELANLVEKTTQYIGKSGYDKTAVFAADSNFTGDSQELSGLMTGWSVIRANVGEVGVTDARQALIGSINNGVALASYFGHSAHNKWSHEGLFDLDDALSLTNVGKPTVVTQYGCWNTYYVSPSTNTLGHKLLLNQNGAAVVTGATTLTSAVSEAKLGELMMPALASGATIGQAMQDSKAALEKTDPEMVDVLLGWTILGVPWLEVE